MTIGFAEKCPQIQNKTLAGETENRPE